MLYFNDHFRYLYIKGLHDRDEILDARLAVLEYVQSTGEGKFAANVPLQQGILDQRCGRGCVPYMEVIQQIRFYFSFMFLPNDGGINGQCVSEEQ